MENIAKLVQPVPDSELETHENLITRREMGRLLRFSRSYFDALVRSGVLPAPTISLGKRYYYRREELTNIRSSYRDRYKGVVGQRQLARILGVKSEMIWRLANVGIIDSPSTAVGNGRRKYWKLEEVERIRGQLVSWQQRYVFTGVCPCSHCKYREATGGFSECAACREKGRKMQAKRIVLGKCTSCGGEATPKRSKCADCAARAIETTRKFVADHKAQGLCTACSEPAVPGNANCPKHKEMCRQRAKRNYYNERKRLIL
jgi:predicted DNA-binding transcriptional regulator AlpA